MGKKLYITTAIPYVNAKPHIGNALDYLLADIWSRYQKQNGHDVRFQAGTDEHGNKIAAKAAEAGLEPKAYTDQTYVNFQELMKKVGAEYTDFVRTTDEHHIEASQWIWKKLQPYIYKGKYEGWYCVGHEAFFTDKEVEATNGVCPDHQKPYERISEENYYLKTSEFTDKIREAIENDRMKIVPESRKKEFLELIKDGLKDVSVSRPRKSLSWGIPVPDDPDQVMYVWIEALSNYLTVLGFPDKEGWQEYWPADIQVIGKDILRFHAGIWPAILLGIGASLPKKLLVHGFINVGGAKMSKSVGNVVDPNEIIDDYGVDTFRYFFARHIPTLDDGDFTWEKFENAYNNELGNDLGNLVQRVASMVVRYQSGVIGDAPQTEHDMQPYRDAMYNLEFNSALDQVWLMVRSLNQYLENVKPWEVAKKRETDTEAEGHLAEILATAVGTLLQIGDLLVPFMPATAASIQATFETGIVKPADHVLFPKIYKHTPDPHAKKEEPKKEQPKQDQPAKDESAEPKPEVPTPAS
jgi:methionyl-tRNA synthetase